MARVLQRRTARLLIQLHSGARQLLRELVANDRQPRAAGILPAGRGQIRGRRLRRVLCGRGLLLRLRRWQFHRIGHGRRVWGRIPAAGVGGWRNRCCPCAGCVCKGRMHKVLN